jgi:hypothetical protein
MQIFNSYNDLTAYGNESKPCHNVLSYFETENTIQGAVAATEGMDDAKMMYSGAVSAVGNVPGAESVMADSKVQEARVKIEDGTQEAAEELKDADAKDEFRATGNPDFPGSMAMVHDVNQTVQEGVKKLKVARRKLDIPVSADVEQAAYEVQKYAKKASETSPSQYTPERHNEDSLEQVAKWSERQSRPRSAWQ